MTTVYRTYAPSGDVDHPKFGDLIEWIDNDGIDVTRVAKIEYDGDVDWDEDMMQASGKLLFAVDYTKFVAGWLRSCWEDNDDMLENNPHELVYKYENVDQMRQERMDLIEEERGRPSYGGV
jgi:hypothetical protein